RTRLGDHRRNLPVPKLVAGQGPRAAEARSPLGRRRQGKAGRPGLRDLLDQAARTWSRVLHRPGSRPRGLGGRAFPPPSARGNPLGDGRAVRGLLAGLGDRKSTRLNSSHVKISYAVFCLKKKIKQILPVL